MNTKPLNSEDWHLLHCSDAVDVPNISEKQIY